MALGSTFGLAMAAGSGAGDARLAFRGTLDNVNRALADLAYARTAAFEGGDALRIAVAGDGAAPGAGSTTYLDLVLESDAARALPALASVEPRRGERARRQHA